MKFRLLSVGAVVALASHPLQSLAHGNALTHQHVWHTSLSLIGLVVFLLLVATVKRIIKLHGAS